MKLIYCPECEDIIKLDFGTKYCRCKISYGNYTDKLNASIGGKAIPLGIENKSFAKALKNQPENGHGILFEAFVIPKKCDTVKHFGK